MKRKIAVMCVLALTGTMMLTACGNKKDSNNGKTSDGKTVIMERQVTERQQYVLQHGM